MKWIFQSLIMLLLLPLTSRSQEVLNLGAPINTENVEDSPFISTDGNWLYFSSNRDGGSGGMDIWVSQKVSGVWTTPVNLGSTINSSANEGGIYVSPDGNKLYFTSDRAGGLGGSDIWVSTKVGGNWTPPVNIGAPINSPAEDGFLCLSSDGNKLYFSSTREGGYGGLDIWVSTKTGSAWGEPENLGPAVNTEMDEWCPSLSADGQKLYFTSNRNGGKGGDDIWAVENIGGSWLHPTPIPQINSFHEEFMPSSLGNTIFFTSFREGGVGMADIWDYNY
jgi:Tol biopolymer transport system component